MNRWAIVGRPCGTLASRQPADSAAGARQAGGVRHRAGQPEQGTRTGGRGHLHRVARGPDQPGVHGERSGHRHGD